MKTASPPTLYPAKPTGIARWMPGVAALRWYQRAWLAKDLTAGLVLSALLVPQGMAYAELAGLPPITGLYTTVLCLVGYALFGPSRILVLGPDSSLGPMIAAAILPLAAGSDEHAIALAGMLALLVGLLQSFGILIFPAISIVLLFAIMAVVLIVRPWGLLGRPEACSCARPPGSAS